MDLVDGMGVFIFFRGLGGFWVWGMGWVGEMCREEGEREGYG